MGRYSKAIASAIAGVVAVVGAIYTNADPETINGQTTAISGALGALVTGLSAYFAPRNSE